MKKFSLIALVLLCFSNCLFAHPEIFDIYGVDEKTKQKIYTCCSEIVEQYLNAHQKLFASQAEPNKKDMVQVLRLQDKMVAKIKKVDNFADVKLSVIYYSGTRKPYATLDIVKKSEQDRIPNKKRVNNRKQMDLKQEIKLLFQTWDDYNTQKMKLIRTSEISFGKVTCPVMHCTFGFNQEETKSILPKLQEGVIKYKQDLFNIIALSQNDQQRGDAVFILANDTNYNEVAGFLIHYTDDSSDLVRNNVMRVLGAIIAKHKISNLNINKIIQALNYPYVTDRNKAAYVLLGMIKSDPNIHQQVIQQAGFTLVELLKLSQPNNHDFAYHILKEISHKNYSEYDYQSWSAWLATQHESKC